MSNGSRCCCRPYLSRPKERTVEISEAPHPKGRSRIHFSSLEVFNVLLQQKSPEFSRNRLSSKQYGKKPKSTRINRSKDSILKLSLPPFLNEIKVSFERSFHLSPSLTSKQYPKGPKKCQQKQYSPNEPKPSITGSGKRSLA